MNGMSVARNPQNSFYTLKKKGGVQNRIRKLIVEEKDITDHKEISKNMKHSMKHFLNKTSQKLMLKNNDSLIL